MKAIIITDCKDQNVTGRQIIRYGTLLRSEVHLVGVESDLEAAGNLIDCLDSFGEGKGTIIVNVAPRNYSGKKWKNGSPFCYFNYRNVLVISTIDGLTLSLVKKLGFVKSVELLNAKIVLDSAVSAKWMKRRQAYSVLNTQFRSFEFVPLVAKWLSEGKKLPSRAHDFSEIPETNAVVWFVDNFGNCKTTLTEEDIKIDNDKVVKTSRGVLVYHKHLRNVPDGEPAITYGSSGLNDQRFLEIVVGGGNAAETLNLEVGSSVY